MEERQKMLSQKLAKQSLVKDWEQVTGYTWHRGDYHWLLYRAGDQGPSYNNLNDTTNTVWYILEKMKDYTRELNSEQDLTYVPWSAFESLACWYNCKIEGKETAEFSDFEKADVHIFCQIYDRLSKDDINDPAELYYKGIMEYLNYGALK